MATSSYSSSLEDVLMKEVQDSFHEKNTSSPESLETIKINIFKRVANILNLSIVDDLLDVSSSRIVLSQETSRHLDNTWNRIMINRGCDTKISKKTQNIRDAVLSNVYVEKNVILKFITILLRKDSMEPNENVSLLKSNLINILLAVDGFGGIAVRDYKNYINNLNDRLPERIKKHILAVRTMYTYFNSKSMSSINTNDGGGCDFYNVNGTETTCIIFLTLLNLYRDRVGSRLDDCINLILDRLEKCVVNFMDVIDNRKYRKNHSENNNDNKNYIEKRKFRKLRKIYCNCLADNEMLDWIAFEKINGPNFSVLQHQLEGLQQQ